MTVAKRLAALCFTSAILSVSILSSAACAEQIKIGLVVKSLNSGFFEAVYKGAEEAAEELKDVEIIYTGPVGTAPDGQVAVINDLIAQGVNGIAISASDMNASAPALKSAAAHGIKVISFDSPVARDARILHLNPSSNSLIAKMCLMLAKAHTNGKANVAILSATPNSAGQNAWISEMKRQAPDFPDLTLTKVVYGDDVEATSRKETEQLLASGERVDVILAPTTVGIAAAAKVIAEKGLIGKVYVTGLGLPSEMTDAIKSGATKEFAIWNPIDLGYSATQVVYHLVQGETDGSPGSEVGIGRMGKIKVGPEGEAAMGDPFVYNATNVGTFAKVF
ncbi:rhamnose ABC transporter substrate-binding protein [Oryzifoliimicrobium ureilyticus]|uniref:rhamnose ABC transporter substrate-binding protein n=1 Tax=Oryzifoliimicrobium ureilyticus TaxID=3113724 RepID=UPI0030766365